MKKGFTLFELLVVIGIIVLLVTIVMIAIKKDESRGEISTAASTVQAYLPEPTGYVLDTADVLSQETENKITAMAKSSGKHELAVITVKTTAPLSIEEYGIKLAEKWKVGEKGYDNGVIFIIATEDRKLRIEVGKGLEGQINDAKAGRILDTSVVPLLKKGDWNGGILSGVNEIINNLK